jgi:hypothetical protein
MGFREHVVAGGRAGVAADVIRWAALAAVLFGAAACGGSHRQSAAQLHHHYFVVGEHACKHLVKHTASSVTVYAVDLKAYPAAYRHDVARGCAADR